LTNRSSVLNNQALNVDLSGKFNAMTEEIQNLLQLFRSNTTTSSVAEPVSNSDEINASLADNARIMKNLESCVLSGETILSSATSIISSRSTVFDGSEFGQELSEQERISIENWIPLLTIKETQEEGHEGRSISPVKAGQTDFIDASNDTETSTITGDTPTRHNQPNESNVFEEQLIMNWRETAERNFHSRNYAEAEKYLQRVLERLEARYNTDFEARNTMREMLANAYYRQNKWPLAAKVFLGLLEAHKDEFPKSIDLMQQVAEIYYRNGDLDLAEGFCLKAAEGRKTEHNVRFYESISLLVDIYKAKGDNVESDGYMQILPNGISSSL